MTIHITEKQMLAIRKHAMPALRKLNIKELDNLEVHRLEWSELSARAKAARIEARDVANKMEDGLDEKTVNELEAAFDGLQEVCEAFESEKTTRMDIGSKQPRSHGGDPRIPGLGTTIYARGDGQASYEDNVVKAIGLKREQRMASHIADRNFEHYDLTPGAYLRAMVVGAKSEAEKRALSEGTDSAGGFTVPDILSAQVIDMVRAQSTVVRAGALTVPLESDVQHIAKVISDPIPAWRNEAAAVTEADPTFSRVTFTPRSLAVLVKVSRELLEDSLNMETLLPQIMTSAMAVELDRVALFGSGTAPEPQGVVNFSGVQEVAHNMGLETYNTLISARTLIKTANFDGVSAYIMHPREEGVIAGFVGNDAHPLQLPPAIAEVPFLTSTSVPIDGGAGSDEGSIITGKFDNLMIGLRHGVTIQILKERFQDTGQYGFIAFMRADIAATHENAFCKITGITP
jgi:HK97 family phage major capsid protein